MCHVHQTPPLLISGGRQRYRQGISCGRLLAASGEEDAVSELPHEGVAGDHHHSAEVALSLRI